MWTYEHTDVSITSMRVELYVSDVCKLFARLLTSAETEFNANAMINVNSIH